MISLLHPKPSESSVSAPAQGGYLECGGGVMEWGLGSDDETQSLEKYTVSPPEQSRPKVGVPLPRSPHLAKYLQPSFPVHFAAWTVRDRLENSSSPQPEKIDMWTHFTNLAVSQNRLENLVYTWCVCLS